MFEREIKFIYDFNLNKVNRLGPYFTFEQLSTTDIHPAILHYISAEIDFLVFEDRQKLLKNSVFDYSGEKISYNFLQITEELKKTKRFSLEYIAKLILHASSFSINYLIRPKWTLSKFVFDESNHKSTNEIKQILNYVYYYKYLIKIISSYINTKKLLSMNVEEFDALLNRADKLGVELYLPNILATSLKSMAEFFNIGEIKKFRIPIMAVELFLEEKELFKHLEILNRTFGSDENAKFNIYDLQRVLGSIMLEKSETQPESKETTQFEVVPARVDLQEDNNVVKETDENIPEEKYKPQPVNEEEVNSADALSKGNEIPEEESEEELIKLKYINEINDNEEIEEEEIPVKEDSSKDYKDALIDDSEDEPKLSLAGFQVDEKPETKEHDNFFEDEEEEKLKQDQDNLKIPEPVQKSKFEKETEKGNNEFTKLSENEEKETGDSYQPGNDEKIDFKIEEIAAAEEELRIKLNTKFRIRVNEDNRIEPVIEEPNISHDDNRLFGEEPEDLLDKFTGGNPIFEVETESRNTEETDEVPNIIPEESLLPDLNVYDSEVIIPEPHKLEEYENVITNEKKDIFNAGIKPDKEEPERMPQDLDDEFFELKIPAIPNIIEDEIPEDNRILLFGDDGLESNKIDEKGAPEKTDESVEENLEDQSNFKDIFNKEIKVFDDDEIESNPRIPEIRERKINIADILEHKDMTKIIEVIFDFDFEDFANTFEELANCKNVNEANILLKDILAERRINRHSKEIEAFRSIILELFN